MNIFSLRERDDPTGHNSDDHSKVSLDESERCLLNQYHLTKPPLTSDNLSSNEFVEKRHPDWNLVLLVLWTLLVPFTFRTYADISTRSYCLSDFLYRGFDGCLHSTVPYILESIGVRHSWRVSLILTSTWIHYHHDPFLLPYTTTYLTYSISPSEEETETRSSSPFF